MEFLDDLTEDELNLIRNSRKVKQHEEYGYLNLMKNILDHGVIKNDRTGVGTKSIFGTQLKFDLTKSFPILTTKKVFWKGVVEELLWFIRGEMDSTKLSDKGVNIWKGNTSREFLDKQGLTYYPEGWIGPGYGYQWRNFNGPFIGKLPQENQEMFFKDAVILNRIGSNGIDQLADVVERIKTNPNDRRMIVSSWNPNQLNMMALSPCHLLNQFSVENGELSCQWYQRSVDTFLGLPFNISSYALLTYLIAEITGLKPGKLTFVGGDTHIYLNHIDQVKEQLIRTPHSFPKLNIKKDIKTLQDIENLQFEDIELIDYKCHPVIKAPMAI